MDNSLGTEVVSTNLGLQLHHIAYATCSKLMSDETDTTDVAGIIEVDHHALKAER